MNISIETIAAVYDGKNGKCCCTPRYEVRLSNVPDGASREDYLGHDRYCATKAEAREVVAQFNRAKRQHPEDFEPEMEAEVVAL